MNVLNEDFLTKPRRKQECRTKIVHLSDLHFRPDTNPKTDDHLIALKDNIYSNDPDIIIVTGDLVDNGPPLKGKTLTSNKYDNALDIAKDFLITTCHKCGIDEKYGLYIVPGNHDYRYWGISAKKWFLFERSDSRTFNEKLKDFIVSRPIPSLGIVLCLFDSNVVNDHWVNFASGFVDESKLLNFFSEKFNLWKDAKNGRGNPVIPWFDNLTKIAILHHHPMPIPDTQTGGIEEREELLLLKNAGVFMREMVRNNIDLILHGHRHYPSYSRFGFPDYTEGMRYLGIVAAGTVGLRDPFYSYNLIELYDDGNITLQRFHRRTGSYIPMGEIFYLLPEEEVRQKKSRNSIKSNKIKIAINELTYSYIIYPNGDHKTEARYNGCSTIESEIIASLPRSYGHSKASIHKEPKVKSRTNGQSIYWKTLNETNEKLVGEYIFDPPLSRRPIDLTISNIATNTFFFNKRDLEPLTRERHLPPRECVHTKINFLVNTLKKCIAFPKEFKPTDPRVEVYSNLEDSIKEEGETLYCKSNLHYDEQTNTIFFMISNPIPGFSYKISWDLPSDDYELTSLEPADKGMVNEIRKKLLSLNSNQSKNILDHLGELRIQITESAAFKSVKGNDRFEICLMGFDDRDRCLKVVSVDSCQYGKYPDDHDIWKRKFYVGEGVVGQALRRKEPVLYTAFSGCEEDDSIVYKSHKTCSKSESKDYKLIYSIPLTYPFDVKHTAIIGSLSFATCSNVCKLHKMFQDNIILESIYDQSIDQFKRKIMLDLGV